ncbi:MAG TPA: hypothetical protein PKN09_00070 [Novosphingobium sp.]|nr:hypothetical protein [Novosphingobium sp.]
MISVRFQPNSALSGSTVNPIRLNGMGYAPQVTPTIAASKTFQPLANSPSERLA